MKWMAMALVSLLGWPFPQAAREALHWTGSIPLPNVGGRIDHLSVDLEGHRLFVAALGNNTVEVVDLDTLRVSRSIAGLHEPQGIAFVPDRHRLVVANGGDGAATFFDAGAFTVARTSRLGGDADNVRYDAKAKQVYVGYGSGALAAMDTDGQLLWSARLAGHPESFQLEAAGPRIFVNVPSAGHIAVVDRDTRAVTATWPVNTAKANYPMALDEGHHRLFVGCRGPARLLVYDTASGRQVTSMEIVGDTDDVFYDQSRHRLYVAGGDGFVTVIEQQDADHYRAMQSVSTPAGARTALFVPELGRLFLAVPRRGTRSAEIAIYNIVN
jgi:YVTN family beta-propeller protein